MKDSGGQLAEDSARQRRDWRWWVVGLSAVLALGLGYFGIADYLKHQPDQPPRTPGDILYLTFRLFTLDGDWITGDKNWAVMTAKFLAPAVALYTAALAALAIFRERLKFLQLRMGKGGHVIICGLGRKGMQMVREFRAQGRVVAAIESDEGNDHISIARELGAVVLVGDAADTVMLRRAGAGRAGRLICVCGNDGTNVESAVRAFDLAGQYENRRAGLLACSVHLVNVALCDLFKQHALFTRREDRFEASVFNADSNAARLLMMEHPPDRVRIGPDSELQVHLVVAGFGPMGQSLLLAAAKVGHFANGRKMAVTVIAADLEARRQRFEARYRQLNQVIDAQWIDADIEDPAGRQCLEQLGSDPNRLVMVAVCLEDRSRNLPVALNLPRVIHQKNIPVLAWLSERTGLASLLEGDRPAAAMGKNIHPFGEVEKVCSLELVLRQKLDQLARAVHRRYVAKRIKEGADPQTDPSIVPWEQLTEGLKESNRQQADHIAVKLRAIGCEMVSADKHPDRPERTITPDELEVLARMEHARWNADRFLAGWTAGEKNNAELKTPYLVDWEQLSEEIKDYDRDPVRNLPELARELGMKIVEKNEL